MGHFAKDCLSKRKTQKRGKHHASTTEDDESTKKQKGSPSEKERRKEFYLVSTLSNIVITGPNIWLVDSGALKHMTRYR